MRISDWSSDVCSSDLIGSSSGGLLCRWGRGTARQGRGSSWRLARLGSALLLGSLVACGVEALDGVGIRYEIWVRLGAGRGEGSSLVGSGSGRSEEHARAGRSTPDRKSVV